MAKKKTGDGGENGDEPTLEDFIDDVTQFAEETGKYSRASKAEDKLNAAGRIHLTAPRALAAVKLIVKAMEETHG